MMNEPEQDESERQFLPKFLNYMKQTYQIWDLLPAELKRDTIKVIYQVIQKDFGDLLEAVMEVGFSPNMIFEVDEISEEFITDLNDAPVQVMILSPLQVAVRNYSYSCMKILIDYGAPVSSSEHILFSVYNNSDFAALMLLLENDADPNERNETGTPLLCVCARNGDIDILKLLITYGASVHAADIATLATPLHYAVSRDRDGHYECVKLLLERGANPNSRNRLNETPAFIAAACSPKCLDLILGYGGEINTVNVSNSTALHKVFVNGKVAAVRLLIDLLPDLNIIDSTGHTVLDYALKYHHMVYIVPNDVDVMMTPTTHVKLLINHNAKTQKFSEADMIELTQRSPHKIELIGLILNSAMNCSYTTNLIQVVSDHVKGKDIAADVESDDRYLEFYDRFYQAAYRPRSLKHFCRCVLREHMGKQFPNVVPTLPIPQSVISYLLLDDPCDLT